MYTNYFFARFLLLWLYFSVLSEAIFAQDSLLIDHILLIDTLQNSVVARLQDSMLVQFDAASIPAVTFQAKTEGSQVRSVLLQLEGPLEFRNVENLAPFTLFGNQGDLFSGRVLPPGDYTISAQAFTEQNAGGTAGLPLEISFRVLPPPRIDSILLINAFANARVRPIELGDTLDIAETGRSINFEVLVKQANSVSFRLENSQGEIIEERVESILPYALFGDSPRGVFVPWEAIPGHYLLSLQAFGEKLASGARGDSVLIAFTIVDSDLSEDSNEKTLAWQVFPNPFQDQLQVKLKDAPAPKKFYLEIRDQYGRIVKSIPCSSDTLPQVLRLSTEEFEIGTYYLILSDRERVWNFQRLRKL